MEVEITFYTVTTTLKKFKSENIRHTCTRIVFAVSKIIIYKKLSHFTISTF